MFSKRISPDKDAQEHISTGVDKAGFEVRYINDEIGKGVFTSRPFPHGMFLLEYRGERISHDAAMKRAKLLKEGNTFLYFFEHEGKTNCIDATKTDAIAKMVNDGVGETANCIVKKKMFNGLPFLCMFALRDIGEGEELRYDYGQPDLPWRQKVQKGSPKELGSTDGQPQQLKQKRVQKGSPKQLRSTDEQLPLQKRKRKQKGSPKPLDSTDDQPPQQKRKRVQKGSPKQLRSTDEQLPLQKRKRKQKGSPKPLDSTDDQPPQQKRKRVQKGSPKQLRSTDEQLPLQKRKRKQKGSPKPLDSTDDQPPQQKRKRVQQGSPKQLRRTDGQPRQLEWKIKQKGSPKPLDSTDDQPPQQKRKRVQKGSPKQLRSTDGQPQQLKRKRLEKVPRRKVKGTGDQHHQQKRRKISTASLPLKITPASFEPDLLIDALSDPGPSNTQQIADISDPGPSNTQQRPDISDPGPSNTERIPVELADSESSRSDSDSSLLSEAEGIVVRLSNSRGRKHSCFFCSKMETKLSKHLERCHPDEVDVARLLVMKKGSDERKKALQVILNKGNFYHNKEVLALKRGEFIPVYRPSFPREADDYSPCPSCLGYYPSEELRKHAAYKCVNRSTIRPTTVEVRLQSNILQDEPKLKKVQPVLAKMKQDSVTMVAKKDSLILQLGENLATKCIGMDSQKKRHYVAQKMRESARLVLKYREITRSDVSLDDIISPKCYDKVIESVQRTAGEVDVSDEDLDGFKHPSVALKLGHDLQKLARIKIVSAIKSEDKERELQAQNFLTLMSEDWLHHVSSPALSVIARRKYSQAEELPSSEDVMLFSNFLSEEIAKSIKTLASVEVEQRSPLYRRAQNLVLAKLTFFNKRRPGEVEQLQLTTFTEREDIGEISELTEGLSTLEQKLCSEFGLLHIRGKRGRKVPLLIPPDCLELMEELSKQRSKAGIHKRNKYFFARFQSFTQVRACDSMRILTAEAGLEKPALLRGTKLRKYTATLSQVLNMKECHNQWLADHLGHSLQVHKEYYRLPSGILEKGKIAKLLLAIDAGNAGQFIGKTLDDISDNDLPASLLLESDEAESVSSSLPDRVKKTADKPPKTADKRKSTAKAKTSNKVQPKEWTAVEKEVLFKAFSKQIRLGKCPKKYECLECMKKNPGKFVGRDWKNLKDCVRNHIVSLKKGLH